ncbi:putative DNA-directed RNA polymerase subunit beta-beta protein, partial [Thalictrum thalictroides]
MPFPMKIQPIDCNTPDGSFRNDSQKPVVKSRFKRLFERQFSSVLKISSSEKSGVGEQNVNKDGSNDFEPSSVCLDKMVQNFIEESNEKQTKCGRNRCNCFNGNCNDSSDDELDFFGGFSDSIGTTTCGDAGDFLK